MPFQKGKSGNPKGRSTRVSEDKALGLIEAVYTDAEERATIRAMINAAKAGDVAAFRALQERKRGKVAPPAPADDGPIEVVVSYE